MAAFLGFQTTNTVLPQVYYFAGLSKASILDLVHFSGSPAFGFFDLSHEYVELTQEQVAGLRLSCFTQRLHCLEDGCSAIFLGSRYSFPWISFWYFLWILDLRYFKKR